MRRMCGPGSVHEVWLPGGPVDPAMTVAMCNACSSLNKAAARAFHDVRSREVPGAQSHHIVNSWH